MQPPGLRSSRATGFAFLALPLVMLPVSLFVIPYTARRVGMHVIISTATIFETAVFALLAALTSTLEKGQGPDDIGSTIAFLAGFLLAAISLFFIQNLNLARCKLIADSYARDARGAVTSASRNCFALGQTVAPAVSGVLFTASMWAPYALVCILLLATLLLFVVAGVPLFRDPPPVTAPVVVAVVADVPAGGKAGGGKASGGLDDAPVSGRAGNGSVRSARSAPDGTSAGASSETTSSTC